MNIYVISNKMFMFYDILSVSVIVCVIIPWVLFLVDGNNVYAIFAVGVMGAELISHILKYILGNKHEVFKRPQGAANCSLFNKGGTCEGAHGFPSGHVTLATAFVVLGLLVLKEYDVPSSILYICCLVGLLYIAGVAISRIRKKCHTGLQTAAGFFFGVIFSMIWWWLFKGMEAK